MSANVEKADSLPRGNLNKNENKIIEQNFEIRTRFLRENLKNKQKL